VQTVSKRAATGRRTYSPPPFAGRDKAAGYKPAVQTWVAGVSPRCATHPKSLPKISFHIPGFPAIFRRMKKLAWSVLFLLAIALPSAGADDDKSLKRRSVQITWDFKIAVRDGVRLSGIVYRPAEQKEPLPVIVTMTPYQASHTAKQGNYFAQNGYVFVSVDDRGRGNSEGVFVPGEVEAKDGYDVIEFLARQLWCNGDVATWGGSWLGFTQWSIAKEFPPHLKAMAPTASVYPGIDYPQAGGIFDAYVLRWLTYVNGRSGNLELFNETTFWNNLTWAHYTSGEAFEKLAERSGITNTVFRKWITHPHPDAFWDAMTPSDAQFARITIPVLTITGHYDDDQLGALTYYRRHLQFAPADATKRHDLVIGPWGHGGTRRPTEELGGVKFGSGAVIDIEKLHRDWYDSVLKGKPRPEFLKDRVMYFVAGENAWHSAPSFDAFAANRLALQLDARGSTHDVLHSGTLTSAAPSEPARAEIVYDPRRLLDRDAYEERTGDAAYLLSQRSSYVLGDDAVYFHSEPFAQDTELSGIPEVRLWLTSDVPDADLELTISEVKADGTAVFLSTTALRLRYRDDPRNPRPLPIDTPVGVDFRQFGFFSQKIAKNSRIRLAIKFASAPSTERNRHTGGVNVSEGVEQARVARIAILTGGEHASVLALPRK